MDNVLSLQEKNVEFCFFFLFNIEINFLDNTNEKAVKFTITQMMIMKF